MNSMDISSLFPRFIEGLHQILPPAQVKKPVWIIAFSGGPDSLALCLLLHQALLEKQGSQNRLSARIIAFHVNHGLRGRESDADLIFAESKARQLGFEFESCTLTPPRSEIRGSTEAWARKARYAALAEAAKRWNAHAVLTGHQRDDQAETVLQRILRGAEYRGLAGMPRSRPLTPQSGVLLVRPLLLFTRAQLQSYLDQHHEKAVQDRSNLDTNIQRNRIRRKLIPALDRALANSAIADELCDLAEAAGAIHCALEKATSLAFSQARIVTMPDAFENPPLYLPFPRHPDQGAAETKIVFERDYLDTLPSMLLYPLFHRAMQRLLTRKDPLLSRKRFQHVAEHLKGSSSESKISLGEGVMMRTNESKVWIYPQARAPLACRSYEPVMLKAPGSARLPDGHTITAERFEDPEKVRYAREGNDPLIQVLDADLTGDSLHIRQRRAGDGFQPLGTSGPKKLKTFLINEKVPKHFRDCLGLLCNEKEIVWVMGKRIHHDFRITASTKRYLLLSIRPAPKRRS
ncbi:MAG: tRNA lysidine(34) synthetase TilS [Planctomycetota bacterium]